MIYMYIALKKYSFSVYSKNDILKLSLLPEPLAVRSRMFGSALKEEEKKNFCIKYKREKL